MIIIVFSIGQLVSSDLNVLKRQFGAWCATHHCLLTEALLQDWSIDQLIELYITKKITIDAIYKKFNTEFLIENGVTPMPFEAFSLILSEAMQHSSQESFDVEPVAASFTHQLHDWLMHQPIQQTNQLWLSDKKMCVTGELVWSWMVKNLNPLRLGQIDLAAFCDKFNAYFNQESSSQITLEEFEAIFKQMANINATSQDFLMQFQTFLSDYDGQVKCLCVSHTNWCQFNHILAQTPQLSTCIVDNTVHALPEQHILFVPSMISQTPEHTGTFDYALNQLQLENSNVQFLSFLDAIKPEKINKPTLVLEYVDPYVNIDGKKTLNTQHLATLIDDFKRKHEANPKTIL
jgi:hypothetical protein